jgi:hypothetical protein
VRHGFRDRILFSTVLKDRVDEIGEAWVTRGEKMNAQRIVVGRPDWKRPLRRPSFRWVDGDKMGCYALDSSGSAW